MRTRKPDPDRFDQGVCAALCVVASCDYESVWREIVKCNGGYDHLRAVSKRGGNLRMDGFVRYKRESQP